GAATAGEPRGACEARTAETVSASRSTERRMDGTRFSFGPRLLCNYYESRLFKRLSQHRVALSGDSEAANAGAWAEPRTCDPRGTRCTTHPTAVHARAHP